MHIIKYFLVSKKDNGVLTQTATKFSTEIFSHSALTAMHTLYIINRTEQISYILC